MDFVTGSGNSRRKFTMQTGHNIRKMEKEQPKEYIKLKGEVMSIIRSQNEHFRVV